MDLVHGCTLQPNWGRFLNTLTFEKFIEQLLGYKPRNITPFKRAFTHGSTGEEDYQRLEFLGDRVLGLIIAQHIYERFPKEPEGSLSQRLNLLVSGKTCAKVARKIGVQPHIILGKQARDDGARESDNVLGDIMESLIGALYLDQGLVASRIFIEKHWGDLIGNEKNIAKHPKSDLQEWCASNNRKMPVYELVEKSGPPHATLFTISVTVKGYDSVTAQANSKQAAQTVAAAKFLEQHI